MGKVMLEQEVIGESAGVQERREGEGVLIHDKPEKLRGRDERGRLLPGHGLGIGGRHPKVRERAVLDAINKAMPPEKVTSIIEEMITIAQTTKSWRGLASALEFCAAYQLGKPVQQIISESGGLAAVLMELEVAEETSDK